MADKLVIPEWDEKYGVGIHEIDLQHELFLKIIKRVSQSHNDYISIDLLSNYIEEILLYARFHFCSEENLMTLNNYPKSESHKDLHVELIRALADMISMYRINKIERDDILSFLVEWFIEHTTKEDIKLAEYLKKQ